MRICLISPYPPEENGLAEYSELSVEQLVSLNKSLEIHVISSRLRRTADDPNSTKSPIFVHRIWEAKGVLIPLKAFLRILSIRPEVINVHYGLAADYGGIAGEPMIVLLCLLKLAGYPIIVTLHGVWSSDDLKQRALERGHKRFPISLVQLYVTTLTRIILGISRIIIVPVLQSDTGLAQSLAEKLSLSTSKFVELHHGCPDQSCFGFVPRKETRSSQASTILFFGFVRRSKGIHVGLEAFRHVCTLNPGQDLKMVVAGPVATAEDRDYLHELRELVSRLNISERVSFRIGFLHRTEIGDLFARASLLILPYSRRVGPSGPLCLAATFGLPVVTTRDAKYVVSELGGFVRLVDVNDPIGLQNAMVDSLRDPAKYQEMSRRAYEYAKAHPLLLSAKQMLEEYFRVRNPGEERKENNCDAALGS